MKPTKEPIATPREECQKVADALEVVLTNPYTPSRLSRAIGDYLVNLMNDGVSDPFNPPLLAKWLPFAFEQQSNEMKGGNRHE